MSFYAASAYEAAFFNKTEMGCYMKASLYMRMSTDMQENSIDSQRMALLNYAKVNKIDIITEYIDEGISGRKAASRPAFMKMIDDSEASIFDTVLIYDSSRFARNLEESIVYKSMLKKNGVTLVSITEPVVDEDTSLLTDALMGALNEMYSRKLSKNVKRGMQYKVENGFFQNRPPFGYTKTPSMVPIINEDEATIVRRIFEMFTTTTPSFLGIAKILNGAGIKTSQGNYWRIIEVKRVLMNVSYAGYIPWGDRNKMIYKGKHEALVSKETFEAAQKIIETKPKNRRDSADYKHWLSGLLHCGWCNGKMGFNPHPRVIRFRCVNNAKGLCRPTNSVSVKRLEESFFQLLDDIINDDYTFELDKTVASKPRTTEKDLLVKTLQGLEKKLQRHKWAFSEGIDTIEEYRQNKTDVLHEIDKTNQKINAFNTAPDIKKISANIKAQIINLNAFLLSDTYTIMQKSAAVREIVDHIIYHKATDKMEVFFKQ